jgi:hypothetical protein
MTMQERRQHVKDEAEFLFRRVSEVSAQDSELAARYGQALSGVCAYLATLPTEDDLDAEERVEVIRKLRAEVNPAVRAELQARWDELHPGLVALRRNPCFPKNH